MEMKTSKIKRIWQSSIKPVKFLVNKFYKMNLYENSSDFQSTRSLLDRAQKELDAAKKSRDKKERLAEFYSQKTKFDALEKNLFSVSANRLSPYTLDTANELFKEEKMAFKYRWGYGGIQDDFDAIKPFINKQLRQQYAEAIANYRSWFNYACASAESGAARRESDFIEAHNSRTYSRLVPYRPPWALDKYA